MSAPHRPRSILLAALATLAACAPEPRTAAWTGGVDTLPSGTIVLHNPARGLWDSASTWRLVEDLRIGSVADDQASAFSRIAALAVDRTGRIYVLDRQAQDVRVFDSAGRHVRTSGRKGGGPGEFQRATGLAIDPAGDLWVVDPGSRRFSVFDTAGNLVGTHRRDVPDFGYAWSGGFAAGALWDNWAVFPSGNPATRRTGFFRFAAVGYTDTLLLPPFSEDLYELTRGGRPLSSWPVPFATKELVALDERGFVWRAMSDGYRTTQLSLSGDTVRLVSREYRRLAVTKEDRERALGPLRESMQQDGAEPDPSRIPQYRPALIGMLVDDRGYLWVLPVGEGGGSGLRLDVFDPEGRYLGKVPTPMKSWTVIPHPLIRGDFFYSVERDSLDVPYVVRLRIVGRG